MQKRIAGLVLRASSSALAQASSWPASNKKKHPSGAFSCLQRRCKIYISAGIPPVGGVHGTEPGSGGLTGKGAQGSERMASFFYNGRKTPKQSGFYSGVSGCDEEAPAAKSRLDRKGVFCQVLKPNRRSGSGTKRDGEFSVVGRNQWI